MTDLGKKLLYFFLFFSLFILVLITGFYIWCQALSPQYDGKLNSQQILNDVVIKRDQYAIPFITASSSKDAYFALGFVHAQDRMWQMEMMRRYASGELAEVFGEDLLEVDKFMRILGFKSLVKNDYVNLSKKTKETLAQYSQGVNFAIENGYADSLEQKLFIGAIKKWHPHDSLLWGKLMGLRLSSNWKEELIRAELLKKVPQEVFDLLYPSKPTPVNKSQYQHDIMGWSDLPEMVSSMEAASNSWVVSGDMTESGKPLLANDPHLEFQLPSQWYLASLKMGERMLSGVTAPGVPFLIFGHNEKVAWGFTASNIDIADIFLEEMIDDEHYWHNGKKVPFSIRKEKIKIKDKPDLSFNVRSSIRGPIISDSRLYKESKGENYATALGAIFLEEGDYSVDAIFKMNFSQDAKEFLRAFDAFQAPHQNIVFADTNGNIGYVAPGKIPKRLNRKGYMPVLGKDIKEKWDGALDAKPILMNPSDNMIVNANDNAIPPQYPYTLGFDWDWDFRADQIKALLKKSNKHSLKTFQDIQNDNTSGFVQMILPLLIEKTKYKEEIISRLKKWDGIVLADKIEPLIFYSWVAEIYKKLLRDSMKGEYSKLERIDPYALNVVLSKDKCSAYNESYSNCAELLDESYTNALKKLRKRFGDNPNGWKWGKAHKTNIQHPIFNNIPLLKHFSSVWVPSHGDDVTVNRGRFSLDGSFTAIHGSGYRGIYDLSDLRKSIFMILPGQSGHLFSPHYKDLANHWQRSEYVTLDERANYHYEFTLIPDKSQ